MSLSEKLSVKVHLLKSALPGAKGRFEMDYWKNKFQEEGGKFKNDHYEHLYTTVWGLGHDFFEGKKMLDIGCGPRGSLEWADMTAERVGIDPIVDKYRGLGIEKHKMRYCHSPVEKAPFEDGHFDIVTSFNSLDHVDAVDPAIAEIKRVCKPGGTFLLLVEVLHNPNICEPHTLDWNVVDRFKPEFEVELTEHYEHDAEKMADILAGPRYNHDNPAERSGILKARFRRVG